MEESPSSNEINEVLKALNHEVRRSIIRMLHTSRESIAYSDFLKELKLPASSNVAYHLVLLTKAKVVIKDSKGRYSLTELGERVALLLDIVVEPKSSTFTNLYIGFSRLNPSEILLGAWWIFFLLLGGVFITENIFLGILFVSFALLSLGVLFYKSGTIWALLLINNLLWILFVPERRMHLLSISVSNIVGLMILFPEVHLITDFEPLALILGSFFVGVSAVLSIIYLVQIRRDFSIS